MSTLTRRALFAGGAVGALALAGLGAARVLYDSPVEGGDFFAIDGVAIRGTDPVAYFTDGKPLAGSPDLALDWSGVTWHFASAENRDAFEADPLAYAPQYGGYCAWAVAAKSELYSTQPANWAIVDGKLYLNFNDGVQERWNTDIPGFIATGDENWPGLQEGLAQG